MAIPPWRRHTLINAFHKAVRELKRAGQSYTVQVANSTSDLGAVGTVIRVAGEDKYDVWIPSGERATVVSESLFLAPELYEAAMLEVVTNLLDSDLTIGLQSSFSADDSRDEENADMPNRVASQLKRIQEIQSRTRETLERTKRLREENADMVDHIIYNLSDDHQNGAAIKSELPLISHRTSTSRKPGL